MSEDASGLPGNAPAKGPDQTKAGAATDAAHQDAGDGSATGSVPAGLTVDELKQAGDKRDDGGTG